MARICERCGKSALTGNNVSHSKRRTKRRFQPNLRTITLPVNGELQRMLVCTRCIRTLRKYQTERVAAQDAVKAAVADTAEAAESAAATA